jgi:tetratricopeptide (TPR) repeat protein
MRKASKKEKAVHKATNPEVGRAEGETKNIASNKTTLFLIIIILAVAFGVYFDSLLNGFVYDDIHQVLENPWIKDVRNIPTIFSENVWSFEGVPVVSNYYRPLMHIVYMLNYHIFGLKPCGFHLVNILLHAGVSVLVFVIVVKLFGKIERSNLPPSFFAKEGREGDVTAPERSITQERNEVELPLKQKKVLSAGLIAALLFATHPIHTEAVTWVAGLPEVSFTFFFLLSFYCYLRSREGARGAYYVLSAVTTFFLATFCKETALVLPVILIVYDCTFRKKEKRFVDYLKRHIPYFVVVSVYLILRFRALGGFAPQPAHIRLSAYGYGINVFPLFSQYLEKLLLPINLNAFYVLHPITSVFEAKGLVSIIITAAFIILTFIALKKNGVVFFGSLLLAVPLFPVLYIPALGENIFTERYLYLPSLGYVILLTVLLSWVKEKLPHVMANITIVLLIIVVGLYTVGTVRRNGVWKDNLALFLDTARKSPDSALIHTNLGATYVEKGQLDAAMAEHQTAIRLKPSYPEAHNNLGVAYANKGLLDMAIAEFQTALRLQPNYPEAHYNLGNAYTAVGQVDMAIAQYQMAIRLKPNYAVPHFNLGLIFLRLGAIEMARQEFEMGLEINPDDDKARLILKSLKSR